MMGIVSEKFSKLVQQIGMDQLTRPIFYNSPFGIRFEIGGTESVYLNNKDNDISIVNPLYVDAAFARAETLYNGLPSKPNILRIDVYPKGNDTHEEIKRVAEAGGLPFPHEQVLKQYELDDHDRGESITIIELYWSLEKISFSPSKLLMKTIRADIDNSSEFNADVYFANTDDIYLFFVYDDRGADLVAQNKETIRPLFENFKSCILNYDREKIMRLFDPNNILS